MPPSNKKKQLNNIACDNINNTNNTITNNTIIDNTIIDNTIIDNTISNNTNILQTKPIDNFFGIIIEKPPSPITIIIDETLNRKSQNNIDINIKNNFIDKKIYQSKTIIFSNIDLKKKIELLSEHELCEIFRIIKNNKEKYSTNNNGIFFNVSTLKKISIQEICNFILFCENNNKILEKEEEQREIYRDLVSEN